MKLILFILLSFPLIYSCSANSVTPENFSISLESKDPPSRWELRRSLYQQGEILIIYSPQKEENNGRYQELLATFSKKEIKRRRGSLSIKYKSVTELTQDDFENKVLYFVGVFPDKDLIDKLIVDLPLSCSSQGFNFNDISFYKETDILSLSYYPSPINPSLPFLLLLGNDDEAILGSLRDRYDKGVFLNQNMDIEIFQNQSKTIIGGFDRNWKLDNNAYFDFTNGSKNMLSTDHFEFVSHQNAIEEIELQKLSERMENTSKEIVKFANKIEKDTSKIQIHFYASAEDKGLLLGNTDQSHIDKLSQTVYTIYNKKYENNYLQLENILLLDRLLGKPDSIALEKGLAIYFTEHWQREGYLYWAARLADAEYTLSILDLIDTPEIEFESPLILDCMTGALVSFLIQEWGEQKFKTQYLNWDIKDTELVSLERKWQDYLSQLSTTHPKKIKATKAHDYLQGFNFAHEGYSIYNGYLSSLATRSLEKQKSMGSNAIAIVPYSFMTDPKQAKPLPISRNASSGNMQGIIHSAYEAKKLGMSTMLKPQIWFRGSWPGDVMMQSEEDWTAFFDHYRRWITHYALLAEMQNIELFCVGVEFAQATLAREEQWREIIKGVKKLYNGKVTYAANWGYEFEQVKFWDEVDFIGLNCYYPLSKEDSPSDAELKRNFADVKTKIEKVAKEYNKPIVFTEIGFRSTAMPWKNPHAEDSQDFVAQDQARCYELIFKEIKDEPWCGGILWWKFPSYLDYGGLENNSFTPNNKPAQQVVEKWFNKEN